MKEEKEARVKNIRRLKPRSTWKARNHTKEWKKKRKRMKRNIKEEKQEESKCSERVNGVWESVERPILTTLIRIR